MEATKQEDIPHSYWPQGTNNVFQWHRRWSARHLVQSREDTSKRVFCLFRKRERVFWGDADFVLTSFYITDITSGQMSPAQGQVPKCSSSSKMWKPETKILSWVLRLFSVWSEAVRPRNESKKRKLPMCNEPLQAHSRF